jgi:pimeloyl-ACP methyl ester carboxylesterase
MTWTRSVSASWFATALAALTLSCTEAHPNLDALYGHREPPKTPLVLVHGILGARLRNVRTGREVWPGSSFHLLSHRYNDLSLPIDSESLAADEGDIAAYDVVNRALGHDFYGRLLGTLTGPGQYRDLDLPGRPKTLYSFYYDWRLDNALSAARLDEFIETIRRDKGDPDLRVDIVAHSMGGLVVRYFARFGREDVLDREHPAPTFSGARKIRKAVYVATPNLGAISGLEAAIEGVGVGLGTIPPEVEATWPATYELLPRGDSDWIVDAQGQSIDPDLFDVNTWKKYGWSVFDPRIRKRILRQFKDRTSGERYITTLEGFVARSLVRAGRFLRAIALPLPGGDNEEAVFGGDCVPTQARCLLEWVGGQERVRLKPEEVSRRSRDLHYRALMLEPGDGTVTKRSTLGRALAVPTSTAPSPTNARAFFLCQRHDDLPGNITLRDNLLEILLSR